MNTIVLPNFLICGAQKAGTTALYAYLDRHPDIFMSRPKETWYFDRRYDRGVEWFARHFEDHEGEGAVGEATASTMYHPQAPGRIAQTLHQAQLLFILRNPIERAFSQFYYYVYTGNIDPDRSFREVIRDESSDFRYQLIDWGRYARHLARFDEFFAPDHMKVVLHGRFRSRPEWVLRDIFRFLGVDPSFEPELDTQRNVTRYPASLSAYNWMRRGWHLVRDALDSSVPGFALFVRRVGRRMIFTRERPAMHEDDRAYLREVFAEPNARLEERLGRDLSHWT